VEFNGIRVGTVENVDLEYVVDQRSFRIPVEVTLEPERVSIVGGRLGDVDPQETIETLVDNGMRARLKTGSFITGQLFVDLSMQPVSPARYLGDQQGELPELPTLPQKLDEIANSLTSLLEKVETFPLEEIGIRLLGTVEGMENIVTSPALNNGMVSLQQAAAGISTLVTNLDASVLPATQTALDAAREALGGVRDVTAPASPVRYNLEQALKELGATARSLRELTDFLEQNPSALILGRSGPEEDE
jgi:paraquat-inducible protein B